MLLMGRDWHLTRVNSTASVRPRDPRPNSGDARAGLLRPGRPHRPARATCSTRSGWPRELGLGSVFLSERFNLKDAGVLAGARLRRSRPARHRHGGHQPQHPAPAGHRDDGDDVAPADRRSLRARPRPWLRPALRRDGRCPASPAPRSRTRSASTAGSGTARRSATTGPAGSYPYLTQDTSFDEDIPVLMMAIGDEDPRAGRPGRRRRRAAHVPHRRDAGPLRRDDPRARRARPAATRPSVRIWSVLATVEESIPEELRLRKLVGRLATYLQGYGEVLVRANGWDLGGARAVPRRRRWCRATPAPSTPSAPSRSSPTCATTCCPPSGSRRPRPARAAECAARIQDQLDAGADSVVLHGATPTELAPVLAAWREVRPDGLDRLPDNPGRML